jgi:PAS domain S-box-containing protein
MSLFDESAALLAAIVSSSDDAIISKDLNGHVMSWNAAAERLFGYTAGEMVGQHITRIIPADRLAEEDFVLSSIRSGRPIDHFETIRRRKDGSLVEVSLTVSPVRAADGTIIGASKIAREISERKYMDREVRRLAAIVESADDAIVGKDLNGIVQSWNRGAERIFGYTADDIIGRSITTIIPTERLDEEELVLARVRAGMSVEHFETVRQRKDGSLIDVSLTVSPIRTAAGEVIGASKIARDITEQKRLRRAVEEASRAKDEFLATLSHELRTPLNAVLGYTHMLQQGAVSAADLSKALDTVSRNANILIRLVNDVLDTSRIVTGKISVSFQECDVGPIVQRGVAAIAPSAAKKSIRLTEHVESDLTVRGDPDRLQQIMWNLLSNAVKFTPEGGSVHVSAVREAHRVKIVVEDTGIGITPEALPHIFRRFWQADPAHARSPAGLGLGLSIAREFVELHSGHIQVHSEGEGRGTRFEVVLPAYPTTDRLAIA